MTRATAAKGTLKPRAEPQPVLSAEEFGIFFRFLCYLGYGKTKFSIGLAGPRLGLKGVRQFRGSFGLTVIAWYVLSCHNICVVYSSVEWMGLFGVVFIKFYCSG